MTPDAPEAPLSMRLGARLGPEGLGALLAGAVIVGVALVVLGSRGLAPGSVQPSQPGPSPGASEAASSSSHLVPSPTLDTATARVVVQIVDDLLAKRAGLADAVSPRRPEPQEIAVRLRAVNAAILTLQAPLAKLQSGGMGAIADRILAISDSARAVVADTQRASLANVAAYKEGGQKVVDILEPLVGLRAELATIAEGSPSQSPASSQAEPSATTP